MARIEAAARRRRSAGRSGRSGPPAPFAARDDRRARAVGEERRGAAVVVVGEAAQQSAPITSTCSRAPGLDLRRRPARARTGSRCRRRRRPSRRRGARRASAATSGAALGSSSSARDGRDEHEVELGGVDARPRRARCAPGGGGEVLTGVSPSLGVAALADAGAVDDPLLGHARALGDGRRSRPRWSGTAIADRGAAPRRAQVRGAPAGARRAPLAEAALRHGRPPSRAEPRPPRRRALRDEAGEDPAGPGLDEAASRRSSSQRAQHAGQRTGLVSASASRRGRRRRARAVTQESTGTRGSRNSISLDQRAEGLDGGLHQRRVEGAGDRQALGAHLALGAAAPRASSSASAAPGEHELVGRVVVGDVSPVLGGDLRPPARARRARARRACRRRRSARPPPASGGRGRRRGAGRPRRRARSAATSAAISPSEWPAIRSALAARPRSCFQPASAGAEDRGLRQAGAVGGALEGVVAETSARASSSRSGRWRATSVAHVRGLAALAGEEERECRVGVEPSIGTVPPAGR